MSQTTLVKRSAFLAAATGLGAAGVMAVQGTAQAAKCLEWGFPGAVTVNVTGNFVPPDDDGFTLSFNGTGVVTGAVPAKMSGVPIVGSVDGTAVGAVGYDGAVRITFESNQNPPVKIELGGNLNDGAIASGPTDNGQWRASPAFKCIKEDTAAAAPPQPQPQPGAQKQGPAVTAEPGLAGVTFHITDRSGVASQCTYSSEGYQDSFSLPANGSHDLFVPAVRLFKERTGEITCDNGTSTPTSVFY
jgi:hypothetical protein